MVTEKIYNVSTSEVSTFLTCKRRWMYAHHPSYNLEPRTLGEALTRGVVGHKALEIFYKGLMEGKTYSESTGEANEYLVAKTLHEITVGDSIKSSMLANLGSLLTEYFLTVESDLKGYDIIGVENSVSAPLPNVNHIRFAGRVDLTKQVNSGPNKGEVIPEDHKFSYNFWNEAALTMNPQLPNYVNALRSMGYRSRRGEMNFIRYRENAIEKFKKESVPAPSAVRDEFFRNHTKAAIEIVSLKKLPDVTRIVTRSSSKFNCEYCPFYKLCNLELRGLDSTTMIKASFRPNSYGYDSELDIS